MARPGNVEGLLEIGSEHKLRSENLAFDIDVWYPAIREYTFRTEFIPFTKREARAILNYQHYAFNERKNRFSSEDVEVLLALKQRIQTCLKKNFSKGKKGAFLRLCGRSPKDAEPFSRAHILRNYSDVLADINEKSERDYRDCPVELNENYIEANNRLRAISKVQWLKVTKAEDAMSLLLTSERVFADLHDWLEWGEPEQIVLREWDDEISMEYEFRAFIHRNQLNAISQYDHYCIYPSLFALQDLIKDKIFALWERVHEKVGVESYVMDFVYYPSSQTVRVIEISPFLRCTGPACFHWDNDKHLLENGPFEMRINRRVHPQLDELITSNWDMRWERKPHNYQAVLQRFVQSRSEKKIISFVALILVFIFLSVFTSLPTSTLQIASFFIIFFYFLRSRYFKSLRFWERKKQKYLFVYGTLKRNFHWNQKYMSRCTFVSPAKTRTPFHLVVGESGVPYLLDEAQYLREVLSSNSPFKEMLGRIIEGEIWEVDDVALEGLDEYEGIHKGYYVRKSIPVQRSGLFFNSYTIADAYFKIEYTPELWNSPRYSVYSLDYHKEHYKAIKHILVKQEKYLSVPDSEIKS